LTLALNGALIERRVPSANCDYRDFYANLRDAMLGKAKLAVSPEWALEVMRLLELARQSSHERRTVSVPVLN
jgi:predicted dehydrogenase